jgi:hypothetical protein
MARMSLKEMQEFKSLVGEVSKAFSELNKTMRGLDPNPKAVKELKTLNDSVEDIQGGFSHLKNMWKASPGQMGKAATAAQKWSEEIKGAAAAAGNMKGAMGVAAKAAGALGSVVGGISRSLLGMPGLILMGIKAVIDTAMKIDTYVKNMNKDFARVRGPQIMTRDVGKQFKDFNSAVTSIGDNLRDGLQVGEVKNFMESLTNTGMRITTLNEGFYNYRDAVHVAAKASKVFGADMIQVGSFMSKMMVDFKMNLEDVDDSFVQVAFDAEKSGMSTDRFWSAVQNASASLSFYGSFIKGVSKNIKAFSETQVTGAEESVQAVEQMTKMFSKNSTQANMAFIEIAKKGGQTTKELRAKFNEVADIYKGKSADIELKIAASKDATEIEKLRGEQKRYNMLATRAQNAAVAPTIGMAQEMGLLADQAPELILDLIKGINNNNLSTNLLGEPLEAIIKGVEGVSKGQISQDLVRQLVAASKSAADQLVGVVTGIGSLVTIDDKTQKSIENVQENTDPETINKISKELADQTGMDNDQAKLLVEAAAADKSFAKFFSNMVTLSREGNLSNEQVAEYMEAFRRKQDVGTNIVKYGYKKQEISDKKALDAYNDTFVKVRAQTLSMQDMKNIVKEGAQWQFAMLTGITDISAGISDLVAASPKATEHKNLREKGLQAASMGALEKEFPEIAEKMKNMDSGAIVHELNNSTKEQMKRLEMLSEVQKKLAEINSPKQVAEILGNINRTIAMGQEPSELDKEMLIALKNVPTSGEADKNFKKQMAQAKVDEKIKEKGAKELIGKNSKAVELLGTVDKSSTKTAELTDALLAASLAEKPGAKKAVVDMLMEKYGGKEVAESDIKRHPAIYSALKKDIEGAKDIRSFKVRDGIVSPSINLEKLKARLNSADVHNDIKQVSRGGIAAVSANDIVVDKNSLANVMGGPPGSAIPMLPEMTAARGTGAGGGNISITVNATEKDLAQKIANEVRAVLYRQQVTGMG